MPNFYQEKKLWKKGFKRVACLDEAGRGPLAGPVTAAAVVIVPNSRFLFSDLKDSKKLTLKKREEFYKLITKSPAIKWGIGKVSEKMIDKINILEATKLAMKKAIDNLNYKLKIENYKINYLILDGKIKIDLSIPQKSIIKADEKVFSCAIASILAKVIRDRIMMRLHKKYPKYRFDLHKGYPTKIHLKKLRKYGPCKIHRKSFRPVRTCKRK